jgi:YD repeat-containing protein
LQAVTLPGNNNASLTESYTYSSGHYLSSASSPRYNASTSDGDVTYFNYDASNRLIKTYDNGVVNFKPGVAPFPDDGTNSYLQTPGPATALQTWRTTNFSGYGTGSTTMTDSDAHSTIWSVDSVARVTQTQEYTGEASPTYLLTSATWNSDNNITETIDARGYATDYQYDDNGNTVAVALPSVATNVGTFRPTSLYSYDTHNNLTAYCDPVFTNGASVHGDWGASPPPASDTLCPNIAGATRYTWNTTDSTEPFGCLTDTYTPLGYHRTYLYAVSGQCANNGLPSDVMAATSMSQRDLTTRTPHDTYSYDTYGNVHTYSSGYGSWTLTYDTSMNRLISASDPDGVVSYKCYYSNGEVHYTETASEHAADGNPLTCQSTSPSSAVAYAYDPDGNVTSETHHYGSVAGTTTKWYDGADRLVEVEQPHDPNGHDLYSYAWLTRYIYDLSQNGTVGVDGATFHAYGNLYKTEEYIPSTPNISANSTLTAPAWQDVRGNSFDALDRSLKAYENAFGTVAKTTNTYDTTGNYGLLGQSGNATGQQTTFSYFSTGWLNQKTYQNDPQATPTKTYTYDPDGRAVTLTSAQFGSETKTYDADGRLTLDKDPQGGGYMSPATLTYDYYADGLREDLTISSTAITATNAFQYSYRNDGRLQTQHLTYPITGDFTWTYTNAGRELTQSDPYTNEVVSLYNTNEATTGYTRTLQKKTFTYDSYGRVSSLVLPEGYTYNSFQYDTEDGTTHFARANAYCAPKPTLNGDGSCGGGGRTMTYSVRNELVAVADTNANAKFTKFSADGTLVNAVSGSPQDGFDARSGMITDKYLTKYGILTPYAYDAAGRQTQVTDLYPLNADPQYATRSYDAENHIVKQAYTGTTSFECPSDGELQMCGAYAPNGNGDRIVPIGVTNTYGWGPNGHVIQLGGNYTNTDGSAEIASVHWDGDDVLFALNQFNYMDFEVAKLAISRGSGGLTVVDRDMDGEEVSSHNATAFDAWSAGSVTHLCGAVCQKDQALTIPSTTASNNDMYSAPLTYLSGVREDGYTDGFGNTFQGVRAYDPNLEQWTTPDTYAGDVHDPMSQKPFMWNHNNAIQYEDPSGYVGEGPEEQEEIPEITSEAYRSAQDKAISSDLDRVFGRDEGEPNKISEGAAGHIFDNSGTRDGHVPDTPLNRQIIVRTANDAKAYLGTDKFGNKWYAKTLPSGAQAWASVRGTEIRNGGINPAGQTKTFNPTTGLTAPTPPKQKPNKPN